mmetsp:Transcript_58134/g.156249  ORF Transcript_58134/g.156249 Transcript_58134/m.156249 type:complete len:342 (+) Transcript_58134:10-1035(+)
MAADSKVDHTLIIFSAAAMALQALLGAVPSRGPLDRAALAAHATMLAHGFVCIGTERPQGSEAPSPGVVVGEDGSVSLCIVPAGWNAQPDSYSFCYVHPLRGPEETFELKALGMAGSLAVHAASSLPSGDLLQVTLQVDASSSADQTTEWQAKVAASIAVRMLRRHPSMDALGKAFDASEAAAAAADRSGAAGTKRPAPAEDDRHWRPGSIPAGGDRPMPGFFPGRGDPFFFPVGIGDDYRPPPLIWTPDGGLVGPRHPAWGQVVPGRIAGPRGGGGGLLPRFDPILPGTGEPDHDHLRVPGLPGHLGGGRGLHPDFPSHIFQGGASGRGGRMDPDGMFMM